MAKEKSPDKEKKKKPAFNMWQNMCFMVKTAWKSNEKKVVFICLITAALSVASNLVNLYISPAILSAVERRAPISELLTTILLFAAGIMLVSAAQAYVGSNTIFGRITVRVELIALVNRKGMITSYPNLDDEKFNKLVSKSYDALNSNEKAGEAIWSTMTSLLTNIVGFLIYVSLLTAIQPLLILVILVTTVTGYFIGDYVNGYGYRHREEEAQYGREMGYVSGCAQNWSAGKDIRIFGLRRWLEEVYDKAQAAHMAFHRKAQGVYMWARLADVLLAFLRSGVAYFFLVAQVVSGNLSVAEFLLLFGAVNGFTGWVTGILSGFNTLHVQSMDISTIRECITYPEPFRFEEGEPLQVEDKEYEIRLEHVSFRYPGAEKDTLTDINLTLHPGEKLAVVGRNGAGKTTLVKLLCGFLDPGKGRVLLNGRDIRDFNRADYYGLFSAVFQNYSLLAGTIAMNVAQRDEEADMERVRDCVKKAGLEGKVESLPGTYDTYLNREVYEDAIMLSGGETQRLILARALYKDAPFVVLDEPTAALDPIAESDLYLKYNDMTRGKSSLYISHRLASTRFCNRIILIDDGEIAEEGTHEELLKLGGKYAEMYEVQSKYYKEGADGDGEE